MPYRYEKGAKIMNRKWKRYRVLLIAAGMAVCMTAGLAMGISWSRSRTEKMVTQAADKEFAVTKQKGEDAEDEPAPLYFSVDAQQKMLYKDAVADEEIVKEVCSKFDADFDSVRMKDVTREMRDYEEALWLRKNMGECALLDEEADEKNAVREISSLEIYICEIYAFGEGKAVIESMCKEFGINPKGAVISDLTPEQLAQIGEEAYMTSDHPKE